MVRVLQSALSLLSADVASSVVVLSADVALCIVVPPLSGARLVAFGGNLPLEISDLRLPADKAVRTVNLRYVQTYIT